MATNTEYEELVKGLSKEELTAFKYVCDVMDFASTVNKKSYVLEVLNTTCSRIVFDKREIAISYVNKIYLYKVNSI